MCVLCALAIVYIQHFKSASKMLCVCTSVREKQEKKRQSRNFTKKNWGDFSLVGLRAACLHRQLDYPNNIMHKLNFISSFCCIHVYPKLLWLSIVVVVVVRHFGKEKLHERKDKFICLCYCLSAVFLLFHLNFWMCNFFPSPFAYTLSSSSSSRRGRESFSLLCLITAAFSSSFFCLCSFSDIQNYSLWVPNVHANRIHPFPRRKRGEWAKEKKDLPK